MPLHRVDLPRIPAKNVSSQSKAPVQSNIEKKKHSIKRRKSRTSKERILTVLKAGEAPNNLRLKNGRVRRYDLLRPNAESSIPRKQQEFMAQMAKLKGSPQIQAASSSTKAVKKQEKKGAEAVFVEKKGGDVHKKNSEIAEKANGSNEQSNDKAAKPREKPDPFKGMKPGETVYQFSERLKQESRQLMIDIGRQGNRQREKKRAFYEKRRQRQERKKRRRRGELSDSDVEDDGLDDETRQEISRFPMYWQEILRNNGRPVSEKKRKRIERRERESAAKDIVKFGEQVDRPPKFSALPVQRSKPVTKK